jgi:RNA polymerase sigma-70 factor (family 1)
VKQPADSHVLQLLADGSELAFAQVFDQYQSRVYGVALGLLKSRDLAKDVVQEVFLQVWDRRTRFADVRNMEAYIYGMAKHHTLRLLRTNAASIIANYQFSADVDAAENNIERMITGQYYEHLIQLVVDKLPPQQKKVFMLSRVEGLSHDDIAHKLQISNRTVNNHINAAVKFIRQKMEVRAGSVFLPVFLKIFEQ